MKTYKKTTIGIGLFLVFISLFFSFSVGKVLADSIGKGIAASQITNVSSYKLVSKDQVDATYPGVGTISFKNQGSGIYKPPSGTFCVPDGYPGTLQLTLSDGTKINRGIGSANSENTNLIQVVASSTDSKTGVYTVVGYVAAYAGGTTVSNCSRTISGTALTLSYTPGTTPTGNGSSSSDQTLANVTKDSFAFAKNDGSVIQFTLNGKVINFQDTSPEDGKREFTPVNSSDFCGGGASIKFDDNKQAANPLPITATIPYYDTTASGNGACRSGNDSKVFKFDIDNTGAVATEVLAWSGSTIKSISTKSGLSGLNQQTGDATGTIYAQDASGACGGNYVVILNEANGNAGTLYTLAAIGNGDPTTAIGKAYPRCQVIYPTNYTRSVILSGTYSKTGGGGDTSITGCVTNSGLDWIICPVVKGIGDAAGVINDWVSSSLNFSIHENLPDNGSVEKAWAIIKNLVSVILVIVMLLMVLGQAIGGGPLDAYTIKKLLPRLVVSVILIQISWQMCVYLIQIANDFGQGIGQLIAAPFGGMSQLELPALLNRLSAYWAGAVGGTASITALLLGPTLVFLYWPTLLIMAFSIIVSILLAMGTLLFRNALIIILVILSPLAFLAWVLPGTDSYWKKWKENFTKTLLLFPMVMAMIYGGRIFAWVAGGLGHAGPLDLIAVMAGFFGPYFFLPKTFKWGGSIMASANNAIANSKGLNKFKEGGRKVLEENRDRWKGKNSAYDPFDPTASYGNRQFSIKGKKFSVPMVGGRVLPRLASGSLMPTARGRALTVKKYKEWKEERDAEQRAYVDRQFEVAEKEGFDTDVWGYDDNANNGQGGWVMKHYSKGQKGVGAGKRAIWKAILYGTDRERKVAMEKWMDTSSWIETENTGEALDPDNPNNPNRDYHRRLRDYILKEYAEDEIPRTVDGKILVRPHMIAEFEGIQDTNAEYWGKVTKARPDLNPPLLQSRYNDKNLTELGIGVSGNVEEDRRVRERYKGKRLSDRHRLMLSIDDSYIDANNIGDVAQGYYQAIARAKDPVVREKFAKLLQSIAASGPQGIPTLQKMSGPAGSSIAVDLESALDGTGVSIPSLIEAAKQGTAPPPVHRPAAQPGDFGYGGGQNGGGGNTNQNNNTNAGGGGGTPRPRNDIPPNETPYLHSPQGGTAQNITSPEMHIDRRSLEDIEEATRMGAARGSEQGTRRALNRAGVRPGAGIDRDTVEGGPARDDLLSQGPGNQPPESPQEPPQPPPQTP